MTTKNVQTKLNSGALNYGFLICTSTKYS